MALADLVVIGQPILPDNHFGLNAGFYDDFSSLDLESSSAPGNRTGKWKNGFYADNWCRYGLTWGSDSPYGHAQINRERQKYPSPKYPHPSGWSPYSLSGGNLTITSEPIDVGNSAEYEWARVKGFEHLDGPTGVKSATADNPQGYDPYGQAGPFIHDLRVPYKSGMLTTFGRFAMSFGRFMNRSRMDAGQYGADPRKSQRHAIFPATGWTLREQIYGCDGNGQPIAGGETMYRGNYPKGPDGGRTEMDYNENFGESNTWYHQTLHRNEPHFRQTSKAVDVGYDYTTGFVESGVDVIPHPSGGGKVGFHTNGVYTSVVPMPPEMRDPMKAYRTVEGKPWLEALADGRAFSSLTKGSAERANATVDVIGERTHSDGSPEYMRHCLLMNLARDGNYPMNLAWDVYANPTRSAPAHADTASVEIEWIGAFPLLDDNPDAYGLSFDGVPTDSGGGTSPRNTGNITDTGTPRATINVSGDWYISQRLTGPGSEIPTAISRELVYRVHVPAVIEPGVPADCRVDILALPAGEVASFTWTHGFGPAASFADPTAQQTTITTTTETPEGAYVRCNVTSAPA